jgi:SAM-dependent methyltransferase
VDEKKAIVRDGYDAVSAAYTAAREPSEHELSFLRDLIGRLPEHARVLDVGCGGGAPLALQVSSSLDVTAVDISEQQLDSARSQAPQATFICADMTALDLPDESFDAIYSLYAVIHVPRDEHESLLRNFHRMLRRGGLLLLCSGAADLPDGIEEYFGASMYWSHYDAAANLEMLSRCGFVVLRSELVRDTLDPQIESRHLFVLAVKPGYGDVASLAGAAGTLRKPMTWDEIEEAVGDERAQEIVRRKT